MNNLVIILSSVFYLISLFAIGYYAEVRARLKKSIINNPYIYSLSLAVFCTAWTFFGSVGRSTVTGLEFLFIYIGPTLIAPLFILLLRKIIRISKTQRITSIADFISTRYGKNISLGIIVTLLCVLGIIPYIAIQLKAISSSIEILNGAINQSNNDLNIFKDTTFYIAMGLAAFVILFGTRTIDATEKHEGLVAAVAFESIIKLIAFISAGIFVTYFLFDGFGDIMQKAAADNQLKQLLTFKGGNMYFQTFALMFLSMMAVLFLPRQFHLSVVENIEENHVIKATWLFPLYLFVINIFVIPIAFGGSLIFHGQHINPDTYVLALPMHSGNKLLALLVYIGGFSAASSMIIVETIALGIMISNQIVMPVLLAFKKFKINIDKNISSILLFNRRASIVAIIFFAYLYDKLIAEKYSLVSIGLISFAAVAQFAPCIIGGIYWKQANKKGAVAGILIGFTVWFYTLIFPSITGPLFDAVNQNGLFGMTMLKPTSLFGLDGLDIVTHGFFWSMFFNTIAFVSISLITEKETEEFYQAEMFVDVFKYSRQSAEDSIAWKGTAYIPDLKVLLNNFIGKERTDVILNNYAKKKNININTTTKANPALVNFSERILAGAIGSASARIMVKSVVKEEELSMTEVLKILHESQMMKETNKELRKKSNELQKATDQLQKANEQLKQIDEQKDEFLYTVTHELRTPLTSIRALSEIVHDNPDLPEDMKNEYLGAVVKETQRLSYLITQVLNLERYESGRTKLNISNVDIAALLYATGDRVKSLVTEKGIKLEFKIPFNMPAVKGDEDLLNQVFYNLISNAVKHADAFITVTLQSNTDIMLVQVIDDGKGIAAEVHELIFDKFFQAKNQTLKKPEGSGLGLAICKRIIEMHNGKIWVESEVGHGANFKVEIPTT